MIKQQRKRMPHYHRGSETTLVNDCLSALSLLRVKAWRQNQGALKVGNRFVKFATAKGVSDIIGILPSGHFLAVECKVFPNQPSDDQAQFLANIEQSGGLAIVAYGTQDVIDAVTEFLAKKENQC